MTTFISGSDLVSILEIAKAALSLHPCDMVEDVWDQVDIADEELQRLRLLIDDVLECDTTEVGELNG